MHILCNILGSKSNQAMKRGQLIHYNMINIFLQKSCRKLGRETSSRPLYIFLCQIWVKSKWSAAYFQYISIALNLGFNKNKLHKTLSYWFRDMLNFNFSELNFNFPENGLGLVFPPHFAYDFSHFSCYILLTDQISLSDCLCFSRYWAICTLQLFFNQAVTS